MTKPFHAASAIALCGVLLFLAACSSGTNTSRDMYKGQRKGPNLSTPQTKTQTSPTTPQTQQPKPLSEKRLAAIKAHGLDQQAKPTLLIGMKETDVEDVLGNPSFVRKDKGVEIWQYKANGCILDLFLYKEGAIFSVDHTELRGAHLDSAGELSCFKRIVMGETL